MIAKATAATKSEAHAALGSWLNSRLARRLLLTFLNNHPVNVTTADIPGPTEPLELAGAPIIELFGVLPLVSRVTVGWERCPTSTAWPSPSWPTGTPSATWACSPPQLDAIWTGCAPRESQKALATHPGNLMSCDRPDVRNDRFDVSASPLLSPGTKRPRRAERAVARKQRVGVHLAVRRSQPRGSRCRPACGRTRRVCRAPGRAARRPRLRCRQ